MLFASCANSGCRLALRMITTILVLMANRVARGPLAAMLEGHVMPSHAETEVHLPASIRTRFEALEDMVNSQCDEARRQCCGVALRALVSIYLNVRYFAKRHELQSGHLFRWVVELPGEYIR